ncbi:enoyl-CoA hydratase/isomerase family protein [Nocardioides humi]|uniref:Enoyl-CoA hydratase/isomerase family protein n=1 Tax=Nocardioides humi TaxID=449461 RepID=A0ABN2BRW3_9ACTN|nr:enoyl-CoA hydratase/isomerase family protein [Nocardioides humi]
MTESFSLAERGDCAIVTLHRPASYNALRPEDVAALRTAVRGLEGSVRAVVITGDGGAFCAGSEVRPGLTALGYWAMLREWKLLVRTLRRSPLATIAAVNGLTVCGGFEMILACDFVLVAEDAHVLDQHVKFDLHPGAGTTVALPRRIGSQRALWHLVSGEHLAPERLVELGLALEVCPPDELLDRAVAVAAVVARRAPATFASVKDCVRRSGLPLDRFLERVACLRNTRRLGASGKEVRERRFAENSEVVSTIERGRRPGAEGRTTA